MTAADVQLLLDRCDRRTHVSVRDFAIMMLVARLGLRSIEVARLELRDVDWRAGELVVRGKARRQDRLPLPADVGEALVGYLTWGRAPAGARQLFLTCRAPRGPIRADLVGDVVERACRRAGLPRVGPHRLRHALAVELQAADEYAGLLATPSPAQPSESPSLNQLSARERELVTLVAQGRTDAQVAAQLSISVRTVRSRLDRIGDKTGCRRRADLTRLALSVGLA